ncbi:hypothetical protein GLOIN_2v1033202 [Rhizophagus clarus]|uniref:Uncharacterized protein n=1 Tax=Rhizophagus clarus TaxID=94130 RepID=A0A8H3LMR3_9GLOM|nr:hypothetical protein GLOIN_2v1033202 [Rhizophagus clarus]
MCDFLFLTSGNLWCISCLVAGKNPYDNAFAVEIDTTKLEELDGMELLSLSKISKHFPSQPANEQIHIIVQHPIETKEVHCTVTYGQDEHIVINRECGSEKENVCLVDDEDLASAIWTPGFKVDLPIVAQQPFSSSWAFPQIKTLFGLTADSYIDLPRELADTTSYEKILKHVLL